MKTLAFYKTNLITIVKSFMVLASGCWKYENIYFQNIVGIFLKANSNLKNFFVCYLQMGQGPML